MGNPVVHFEIRAEDPDAAREFYGKLFGWTFPAGALALATNPVERAFLRRRLDEGRRSPAR